MYGKVLEQFFILRPTKRFQNALLYEIFMIFSRFFLSFSSLVIMVDIGFIIFRFYDKTCEFIIIHPLSKNIAHNLLTMKKMVFAKLLKYVPTEKERMVVRHNCNLN